MNDDPLDAHSLLDGAIDVAILAVGILAVLAMITKWMGAI